MAALTHSLAALIALASAAPGFGQAPLPFGTSDDQDDRSRALACLTSAIVYEAGYEPAAGQAAVAEVVMNRLRHPAFPKTICGVVFQGSARRTGCQFTFTCDGSLSKTLPPTLVAQARAVAVAALNGELAPQLAGATHYHANSITPYWAASLVKVTAIGHHIFYRMPGAPELAGVTRYVAAGERLPAPPQSQSDDARPLHNGPTSNAPSARLAFTPWGLAPVVQAAAGTGASATAKE